MCRSSSQAFWIVEGVDWYCPPPQGGEHPFTVDTDWGHASPPSRPRRSPWVFSRVDGHPGRAVFVRVSPAARLASVRRLAGAPRTAPSRGSSEMNEVSEPMLG